MTTLDEIAARADVIDRCLRANPNDCYDRGDLDEAVIAAREDVPKLVAALKAVEAVHAQQLGGTPDGSPADICGGCPSYWPCPTIGAIREALGS